MFDVEKFTSEKKITQRELADILDVSQPFISQIKDGKRELPSDKKKLLKKKFGDISAYIIKPADRANFRKIDWKTVVVSQQETIINLTNTIKRLEYELDVERKKIPIHSVPKTKKTA